MISEEEVKALIVGRIITATESCNSHHISCVQGQIRGLIAVLTGTRPPVHDDIRDILDLIGVPYRLCGEDAFDFDEPWMIAHGFTKRGDDDWNGPGVNEW